MVQELRNSELWQWSYKLLKSTDYTRMKISMELILQFLFMQYEWKLSKYDLGLF
jgi:hypothetical protein